MLDLERRRQISFFLQAECCNHPTRSLFFFALSARLRQQDGRNGMGAQSMFRKGPTIKRKAEKLYAILVTPNEGSGTRVSIEGTEK